MAIAQRTYLEMRDPSWLRPARLPDASLRLVRAEQCYPALYRFLYGEVGRRYHWFDRLSWTDDEIRAHLAQPTVSIWLLLAAGTPGGYFELKEDEDGGIEIAYFGLFDEFLGRGLGAHLLTEAVETAWGFGPARVWLHTCSFDHPAALPNYTRRGFTPYETEEYSV
jgi:GNAT superfamily N-acetyltransferase